MYEAQKKVHIDTTFIQNKIKCSPNLVLALVYIVQPIDMLIIFADLKKTLFLLFSVRIVVVNLLNTEFITIKQNKTLFSTCKIRIFYKGLENGESCLVSHMAFISNFIHILLQTNIINYKFIRFGFCLLYISFVICNMLR